MNTSVQILEINASREKVWDVLFNQYGDIYIHNPTMQSSNYLNDSFEGELNAVRHCQFTDKLFLDEDTIVYTSGSGGNFRSGLPIGKINNEIEDLAVEFFSDLSQLSYVKIQSIKGQIE